MHKYEFEDGKDIHRRVYDELIKSQDLNEIILAECLNYLRVARNHADYDNYVNCPNYFEKNLLKIVEKTKEGIDSLNVLKNNPPYNL